MERRLLPVNAVLDLALADGLNPAPFAEAGWQVVGLEVPVRVTGQVVVCDVVLFNEATGRLLAVEAKSGANIEPDQARKLASVDPYDLILAGGITVPRPVTLRAEPLFVCLGEHSRRILRGLAAIGLTAPTLAVGEWSAQLADVDAASPELAAALGEPVRWRYPIAAVIRFDHQSPENVFNQPVRAELVAEMARGHTAITVRALTEHVTPHFAMFGRRAQGQLVRKVSSAARRAAEADPERLLFQPQTQTTEARVLIARSPEDYDRRGRTQGYQALFGERVRRQPLPEASGQLELDLFSALEEAERAAAEDVSESVGPGSDDIRSEPGDDDRADIGGVPHELDMTDGREGGKRDDHQG